MATKPYPHRARVRHLHSSSRYDRTVRSLILAIRSYVTRHSIITFTEMSRDNRAAALLKFLGWGVARAAKEGGRDECALMYRKRIWRLVNKYPVRLSETGLPSRSGQKVWGLVAVLEHRATGQRLVVLVVHLPANVEGRYRYLVPGTSAVVYRECITKTRLMVTRWVADPNIDAILVTGDWNLSWRREWVRTYLNGRMSPLRCTWTRNVPRTAGTHGTRLIDYSFTDMLIYRASLAPDDESSDHRPFREVLLLPPVAGYRA